jgi:hypothetical protein
MTLFMKELNAGGMQPVVAGWDAFITAVGDPRNLLGVFVGRTTGPRQYICL